MKNSQLFSCKGLQQFSTEVGNAHPVDSLINVTQEGEKRDSLTQNRCYPIATILKILAIFFSIAFLRSKGLRDAKIFCN